MQALYLQQFSWFRVSVLTQIGKVSLYKSVSLEALYGKIYGLSFQHLPESSSKFENDLCCLLDKKIGRKLME